MKGSSPKKQNTAMGTIVLYPAPAMGHLISMVELGQFILKHHPSCTIVVLTLIPSFNTGSMASYVRHISATIPAITFHHLPDIPLDLATYPTMTAVIFELIGRSIHNVGGALRSISPTALIIDLFCSSAMAVAADLSIPLYYFITSGACCLAQILYMPRFHEDYPENFKDMNGYVYSPGLPPIPSSDMPEPVQDRASTMYSDFLHLSHHLPKSAGIIVNTFLSLEPKPIRAITDGLCVTGQPTPPLYCIGPLLADGGNVTHNCLNWLDSQPSQSVVYLSFGSTFQFSRDQLQEIATGLEMSGQRFLWVVRSPPPTEKAEIFQAPPEPDLDWLLPDGFLERTKDRGLVVKDWAPQVAVLSHDSIGGFVTHCGWNSVLEATRAGVPMVTWPLYAEQRLNKVMLVEEMRLALPMEVAASGEVAAAEVEKRVRQLMESEEGRTVREAVKARKKDAARAMSDGGSSRLALAKLVDSWQPTGSGYSS